MKCALSKQLRQLFRCRVVRAYSRPVIATYEVSGEE